MRKVQFLFGIHNHQPIGNFEQVFEEAYQKSYRPLLEVLDRHPRFRWSLHCTGILWEWLERQHPEYLETVRRMVARSQVELLSGGYYEPILPILPDADKIGQIRKLSLYLENKFGVKPEGMWCAERVWEPHLPKPVREAGILYTILDDTHFLAAGLAKEHLSGYYRVEELDQTVDIFPLSHDLRSAIPFKKPEATVDIFKKLAESSRQGPLPVLVMADDGEKFGLWPETYKHVYEDGWLERWISLIEKNADWLETGTFADYRRGQEALGKIALPAASYFEMSGWSLPAEASLEFEEAVRTMSAGSGAEKMERFLKGGIWRNFLFKYAESNSMYKKMLRVSGRIHALERDLEAAASELAGSLKKCRELLAVAFDKMWAGQCNCSYWHGVFGGLYLPVLRHAIYKNLLDAENVADAVAQIWEEALPGAPARPGGRIEQKDFDGDGQDEILLETAVQNLYFQPGSGGALFEWDFKPLSVNLSNVLTRRREAYHEKVKKHVRARKDADCEISSIHSVLASKEKELENHLHYDWYRRAGLIDHFLHPETGMDSFRKCQYGEQGDFVLGRYGVTVEEGPARKRKSPAGAAPASVLSRDLDGKSPLRLRFSRDGTVWVRDRAAAIRVEKTVALQPVPLKDKWQAPAASWEVLYRIRLLGSEPSGELWFAPEFNFALSLYDPALDRPFQGRREWERTDPHHAWKMRVLFSDPSDAWIFPLETVSSSESGFERTFQGLTFVPHWKFSLAPGETFERTLKWVLEKKPD